MRFFGVQREAPVSVEFLDYGNGNRGFCGIIAYFSTYTELYWKTIIYECRYQLALYYAISSAAGRELCLEYFCSEFFCEHFFGSTAIYQKNCLNDPVSSNIMHYQGCIRWVICLVIACSHSVRFLGHESNSALNPCTYHAVRVSPTTFPRTTYLHYELYMYFLGDLCVK